MAIKTVSSFEDAFPIKRNWVNALRGNKSVMPKVSTVLQTVDASAV
jgi:hypothetical protein